MAEIKLIFEDSYLRNAWSDFAEIWYARWSCSTELHMCQNRAIVVSVNNTLVWRTTVRHYRVS